MKIRSLLPEDVTQFRKLRLEALQNSPESFGSSYEEESSYPLQIFEKRLTTSCTLGSFNNEELTGMVRLMRETREKVKHKANIYSMYVTPDKRGQGIGKELVKEAIRQAKEMKGIEQVHLTVVSINEPAKHLYKSLGFEVYGIEKHGLKIGSAYLDEELMYLFL